VQLIADQYAREEEELRRALEQSLQQHDVALLQQHDVALLQQHDVALLQQHDVALLQQSGSSSSSSLRQQHRVEKKQKLDKEIKQVVAEMTPSERRSVLAPLAFGGTGAYRGVFQNIRSFLPGRRGPECDNITNQGKNLY
jgi:hypothetical protein